MTTPPDIAEDPAEVHAPAPKEEETTLPAILPSTSQSPAGFGSRDAFTLLQQQAKMLSVADLTPAPYKENIANCSIALEIAFRVGCSVVMVMQNLDVIKARPSWRSQYIIGAINRHPRFASSLEYIYSGATNTPEWSCYAQAQRTDGKVVKGPTVSMKMAKEEGWLGKEGSKWKTLPELMLGYRAATFFGRLYVPEILMGMLTTEELQDMGERVRATHKAEVVSRFTAPPPPPPCTHDAGPVDQVTPSEYADEPDYHEEVCGGCSKPWSEIEREKENPT